MDIHHLKTYSDDDLVALLKQGNHGAYELIYERYKGQLYLHSLRVLKDEDEAEDVVQDLFTALWEKKYSFPEDRPLPAFLYRALMNRVLDRISYGKVRSRHLESLQSFIDQGEYITDNLVREKELSKLIEAEVARLPEKMRVIFHMSRNLHLSHKEIALQLNISELTVKKQIGNAIRIIKSRVDVLIIFMPFL